MTTAEEIALLEARLAAAETAYHNLMIGGRVTTVVDQNGERIEYDKSSPLRLTAYINSLKAQLALLKGTCPTGPLSVWM